MYREVSLTYCLKYYCKYPDKDIKILFKSESGYQFKSIKDMFKDSICFINISEDVKSAVSDTDTDSKCNRTETVPEYESHQIEYKKTSKVDHGRILALKKAGWTHANIADDVGCSISTVTNTLRRAGL